MISIITPVLNEENNIKPFLEGLNACRGDFELIFADGGSIDRTVRVIENVKDDFKHKLKLVRSERGRGVQMNRGAGAAAGDILLFLHVDTTIDTGSLLEIERTIAAGDCIGGGFTHHFATEDLQLKILAEMGNMRVRARQIFYGDYGIFIRKDIFEKMGGYREIPYLEDVEFCKAAKKYGRLKQIQSSLATSPRRFESIGKFKLSAAFLIALALNMFGKRPEFLNKFIAEK